MPNYEVYEDYYLEQADTLYLPTDAFGYKYCLVVVDVHTRRCDAEKMKNRDSIAVINAFKKIFKRGIVQLPSIISMDAGVEFKNDDINDYFTSLGVHIRYARTNRIAITENNV